MTDVSVQPGASLRSAPIVATATRDALRSERDADIVSRWDAGEPRRSIAADYRLCMSRVSQIARAAGRKHREGGGPGRPWTHEEAAEFAKLGRSIQAARRAGIAAAKNRLLGDANLNMVELVRAGMTYGEAAARLGITRNMVAGAVHRAKQRASA